MTDVQMVSSMARISQASKPQSTQEIIEKGSSVVVASKKASAKKSKSRKKPDEQVEKDVTLHAF